MTGGEIGSVLAALWSDALKIWLTVAGFVSNYPVSVLPTAFLAGVLAANTEARLSIYAALTLLGAWLAQHFGLFNMPEHLAHFLTAVFCLGIGQALSNLLLGKNQTGGLMWICLTAIIMFVGWRIPKLIAGAFGRFPFSGKRK